MVPVLVCGNRLLPFGESISVRTEIDERTVQEETFTVSPWISLSLGRNLKISTALRRIRSSERLPLSRELAPQVTEGEFALRFYRLHFIFASCSFFLSLRQVEALLRRNLGISTDHKGRMRLSERLPRQRELAPQVTEGEFALRFYRLHFIFASCSFFSLPPSKTAFLPPPPSGGGSVATKFQDKHRPFGRMRLSVVSV